MLSTEVMEDGRNIWLSANIPGPKFKTHTNIQTITQDPYLKSNRLLESIQEYEKGGKEGGRGGENDVWIGCQL